MRIIDHPLYKTWVRMRGRCNRPNVDSYPRYGGRGIKVCERWDNSFHSFAEDMGERPVGCTLDRIDNEKGYSPENCRWATKKQQSNNRRDNVFLTHKGVTKTLAQWAVATGINESTVLWRNKQGWATERVLSPSRKYSFRSRQTGKTRSKANTAD